MEIQNPTKRGKKESVKGRFELLARKIFSTILYKDITIKAQYLHLLKDHR